MKTKHPGDKNSGPTKSTSSSKVSTNKGGGSVKRGSISRASSDSRGRSSQVSSKGAVPKLSVPKSSKINVAKAVMVGVKGGKSGKGVRTSGPVGAAGSKATPSLKAQLSVSPGKSSSVSPSASSSGKSSAVKVSAVKAPTSKVASTTPSVAIPSERAPRDKTMQTLSGASVVQRIASARMAKNGPPPQVEKSAEKQKVSLKLVAKAVTKVAVSKITRSEPTVSGQFSRMGTMEATDRNGGGNKIIAGRFNSDVTAKSPAPARGGVNHLTANAAASANGGAIRLETEGADDSSDEPVVFRLGDKIVYPGHGVGEIEGVRTTMLGGQEHHIYNIKILDSGMKVMVPVSQAASVGLRKIIDKRAIDRVYDILKDRDFKIDTQTWNRRFREYSQKIKTGSVYEIAVVLRDLSVLSSDKELSFGEKKMLDMAETLLVSEIAIAKARPHDKIVGELRSLFA